MASPTTAEEVRRRNCRLETFLKKSLDVDSYERIRAHDACVVCSQRDKRAFKFVIISDEWIYLSENPPKKLSPVIHFRDVVSISLATDLAEFLSGAEQQNTQHIVIKYKTDGAKKPSKNKDALQETSRTPRDQILLTARAMKSNRHEALSFTAKHGFIRPGGPYTSRSSRHVTFEEPTKHKPLGTSTSTNSDTESEVPRTPRGTKGLPDTKEKRVTRNIVRKKKRSKSLSRSMDEGLLRETLDQNKADERKTKTGATDEEKSARTGGKGKRKGKSKGGKAENGGDADELRLNLNSGADEDENVSFDPNLVIPRLDLSGLDQSVTPRSILRTSRSTFEEDEDLSSDSDGLIEGIFDLYILDCKSNIAMYLNCAWNSYMIRATLEEDSRCLSRRLFFPPNDGPGASARKYEKLENLFNQLKSELLLPNNNVEEIFDRVEEMKNGAESNFIIKRFFWKTPAMYRFFLGQLKNYLPSSKSVVQNDAMTRADELELILLILETLTMMFRETEIYSSRIERLKDGEGSGLRELLYVLTCQPQLSAANSPTNKELLDLSEEITARATGVLFELMTLSLQNNVVDGDSCNISIPWIVHTLEVLGTLFIFTERLVKQTLAIIYPSDLNELSPEEAILLYHQFHVLAALTKYHPAVLLFVQENFYEEFKYYVHLPVIHRKLPNNYLIRPHLLKDAESVISSILTKTSLTSRRLPLPKKLEQLIKE